MTAREDLLAAADALVGEGQMSFSPAELVARAKADGSTATASTLRTHVLSHMRVDNGNARGRGFVKVGPGRYALSDTPDDLKGPAPQPPPAERTTAASDPHDVWFWEGNVQAAIVRALAVDGWDIVRVAGTASREQGIDVEAKRRTERVVVEVKGYPGDTYSRGPKAGQRKTNSAATQARTYFGNALLSGLLLRSDHPDARVALAFPDIETYRTLSTRVAAPLGAARVELWLVAGDGTITYLQSDALPGLTNAQIDAAITQRVAAASFGDLRDTAEADSVSDGHNELSPGDGSDRRNGP